jgi:hypothetical protein
MKKFLIIFIAAYAGFAGMVSPVDAGFFSSIGPVIAIFAGELFQGVAQGNFDGSGTINIQSHTKPIVSCVGKFTSSAKLGGKGDLQCSDNSSVTIKFQRLSDLAPEKRIS